MKKLIPIISLLFGCVALITCRHEPDPDSGACGEATSIDEMKEWIFFKTGTYWIYQEETTGELDTMTVVSDGEGIHEGTNYRWFSYDVISSRDGWKYYWWFSESYTTNCSLSENCYCHKIYCDKSRPGDSFGEDVMLVFPLYQGNYNNKLGGGEGGIIQISHYPLLATILDTITVSACSFLVENSVNDQWLDVNLVIAKNYGTIQKSIISNSQNWILKKTLIIQ